MRRFTTTVLAFAGAAVLLSGRPTSGNEPPLLTTKPLIVRTPARTDRAPRAKATPTREARTGILPAGLKLKRERCDESSPQLPHLVPHGCVRLPSADWCDPPSAVAGPGWQASVDWLVLQPRGNDFPYATPDCDCGPPDGTPGVLDMDYEPGLRWTVSRTLASGWLDVRGTHLLSETSNAVAADAGHDLKDLVLLRPPAGTIDVAAARSELKFWTAEADYRHSLLGGESWTLDGLLGVRIAALDQNAKAYFDSGDSVRIGTDIRGAGPRAGLDLRKEWGRCYSWARCVGTLLAAQADLDYIQHRPGAGFSVAEYHGEDDRLVPMLDLELGVGYRITENWSIGAGYLYSIWFNAVTPVAYTEALRGGDLYNDVDDTLSFDGTFLRVEYVR